MIVAECSQNFTNFTDAATLVWLANENGADLAKFQLFDSAKLYKEKSPAELSFKQAKDLFDYGKAIGIEVFFSVFDVERVKWCEEIGVKRYKIGALRKSLKVIEAIGKTGKPAMISWSDGLVRTDEFLYRIENRFNLYCPSGYPANRVDFRFIYFEQDEFTGFSDHAVGIDCAKIALARGAEIIEKHFCIDHQTGIDAPWSMDALELKELKRFEKVVRQAL